MRFSIEGSLKSRDSVDKPVITLQQTQTEEQDQVGTRSASGQVPLLATGLLSRFWSSILSHADSIRGQPEFVVLVWFGVYP